MYFKCEVVAMAMKQIDNAAILYDGRIYTGRRHSEIQQANMSLPLLKQGVQGFTNGQGRFVTRDEAREIAKKSGQIAPDFRKTLTSEDLW